MKLLLIAPLLLSIIRPTECSPVIDERAACNKDNLLNALLAPTHLADSNTFCSAYISIPLTSTVTEFSGTCTLSTYGYASQTIHPLQLFNVQPLSGTATPIVYNSASPSPSTVPGGALNFQRYYRRKRDSLPNVVAPSEPTITPSPTISPPELMRRAAAPPLPTWLATTYPPSRISSACSCLSVSASSMTTVTLADYTQVTTSTCTAYTPTTVATYAAICAPSLQANAPSPNSHAKYRVVPSFPVPSKLDCCAACTNVFNCVWWKFDFGTTGDGWAPGTCHYAYYTGTTGDVSEEEPAICPNGITQGINQSFPIAIGREANNDDPGYNYGPCGNALNLFESSQDSGYPDDYYEHDCNSVQPPVYVGDCGNAI